jgi:hypothetical protein
MTSGCAERKYVGPRNPELIHTRPTIAAETGIGHALPSRQLYPDAAEVLYDFSADQVDIDVVTSLVVFETGLRVFVEIIREHLKRIEFVDDGYTSLVLVPGDRSEVVCDPSRSFGRPMFVHGETRVAV